MLFALQVYRVANGSGRRTCVVVCSVVRHSSPTRIAVLLTPRRAIAESCRTFYLTFTKDY